MENKINIAELLKDCPQGMELDCTLLEGLEFDDIIDNEYLPIRCRVKNPDGGYNVYNFTKYGCWLNTTFAKCIIFPKDKTTWEGFQRPFKDGDILTYTSNHTTTFIYRNKDNEPNFSTSFYVACNNAPFNNFLIYNKYALIALNGNCDVRLATEEEKEKLFKAIKANGYKWNAETKTLEKLIKPIFKVGDKIRYKRGNRVKRRIVKINNREEFYYTDDEGSVYFMHQDDWELVPNKFDITTLKPFDKVLVRNSHKQIWTADFFSHNIKESFGGYRFACVGHCWCQCIPYEGNQHLLGTSDDCDNFYKTWE